MMHSVSRLQTTQTMRSGAVTVDTNCWANYVETSRPQHWGLIYRFWASRPCGPAGWLALLLIKAGAVEANPGPTTTHKQVWICDICHKQIHVRKQISIRCNRIEQWVHLRCAGNRQAQYTDTWTCHLHRESGLTTHTDITPPDPGPSPLTLPNLVVFLSQLLVYNFISGTLYIRRRSQLLRENASSEVS